MNWFYSNKSYPDFYQTYLDTFKHKYDDLNDVRFIVFDTETTGLNPLKDKILSIGTVAVKDFKIDVSDSFECYLKQDEFNKDTVEIHGILKEGNIDKIEEYKAVKAFLDHIKNAVLVAHHIAFDVAMINEALKQMGLPKLKNKLIDTGNLYKKTKYLKDNKHYSLDELCEKFNIKMHDRHTASGDAYLTSLLFLKLSYVMKKKKKRLKLNDLLTGFFERLF